MAAPFILPMLFAVTLVAALPCGPPIRVDPSGHTRRCTLDQSAPFAGATIPARSIVFFSADGSVEKMFLSRDTTIQNHTCRGGSDAWETAFYPNGKLRVCWLARGEIIDGIRCRRATFWADVTGGKVGVWLHENGRLSRCELATKFVLGPCHARKGDTVTSDPNGNISVRGVRCGVAPSRSSKQSADDRPNQF